MPERKGSAVSRSSREGRPRLRLASLVVASWVGIGAQSRGAATYYVRTDGGSASQCTGLADAAYSGSGAAQACAWNHPFQALPPGGPARLAGGETLIIGIGSYMMGVGAAGADSCSADASWECYMPAIPSGPSASQPTRILGGGSSSYCSSAPQLWGSQRPSMILNLTDSSNVEIACLEVTDHSGCVEFHSGGLACERGTYPYGDWAPMGLYAEDSSSVTLRDLNVHGLAATGIQAGRLTNWTLERVRIRGNGWVGWDGDIVSDDGNSGTLTFKKWTVEWNGCGETYPGGVPTGCWAQTAGGYGDGVGTGETGGHWVIEDSTFRYNTSDGLDLLYVRRAGSQIEIRRTLAVGNAGNQLKTTGPTTIENSIVVGNCGFFDGQSFTYTFVDADGSHPSVDNRRATGNALSIDVNTGETATVMNSTITSEGDCIVLASCSVENTTCGAATVRMRNNILVGQTDFLQPFESTCLAYQETFSSSPFDVDYSVIQGTRDTCPVGSHDQCVSPQVQNASIDSFDARLTSTSPAINAGTTTGAPTVDFEKNARNSTPDIGALEYGAGPCAVSGATDNDRDGIPNSVEVTEQTNRCAKDNDIFMAPRLFAMQQYRDFLEREGDTNGILYWTATIGGGISRASVTKQFFDSAEFQGTIAPVARLYFAYFNRIPDLSGLQYWLAQYRAGMSLNTISGAFAGSAEFQATYGQLSDTGFVTLIYQNVLGRTPDTAGLAYWEGQLTGGFMTRGQVMAGFSESPEYQQTSYNRVFVTMMYYGMLRRVPEQVGYDYWVAQLVAGASGLSLINGVLGASEYHGRFLG